MKTYALRLLAAAARRLNFAAVAMVFTFSFASPAFAGEHDQEEWLIVPKGYTPEKSWPFILASQQARFDDARVIAVGRVMVGEMNVDTYRVNKYVGRPRALDAQRLDCRQWGNNGKSE